MIEKLKILTFPDPRLRTVAKKVTKFDKSLKKLANDMLKLMYEQNGIGLAATQVNHHIILIVIDISENKDDPLFFVNPEFKVISTDTTLSFEEGCLSVPGFNEEITRPDNIILEWQDLDGKSHKNKPSGILTVCIQHEIDHLEGKLMVDYISPIKRDRIRKKLSR